MINKTQKKALLKSLGEKHIKKIQIYAAENGFLKENKEEYSRSAFSNVFSGYTSHPEVEKIIFAAADYHYSLTQKENESRKKFVTKVNNA